MTVGQTGTWIEKRLVMARTALESRGQGHVFRWWDELNERERGELLSDIESIDWSVAEGLIRTHVLDRPAYAALTDLQPAHVWPQPPAPSDEARYREAAAMGRRLLSEGRVAAFTVAGGQGTRLGISGPKGAVAVSPVGNVTLFEMFAGMVAAARAKYGSPIPWYIMTSPANHAETEAFFEQHGYFGLPRQDVCMFPQGMMPAFDMQGRLLLESRGRLSMAPDGHGGSLKALVRSGSLADMRRRGIEIISYFQVDNPLVRPFDPLFIGLHAATGSEMSTKVARKAEDLERVGNVCRADGRVQVIEYSDFPESLARARNADGSRRFDAGNLAIHLFRVDFVERVAERAQLPFRRAEKAVPCIDTDGNQQRPTSPNAIKLETFVFDVLPMAQNPLVLAVDRAEEFSPVKNATGVDSLETSQRDQQLRGARWLESAGVRVPRHGDRSPAVTLYVAPTFAIDPEDVLRRRSEIPPLRPGATIVLR